MTKSEFIRSATYDMVIDEVTGNWVYDSEWYRVFAWGRREIMEARAARDAEKEGC